jgi:hypothetical protein
MSSFPGTPRVVRGGLVLLAPDSGIVQRVVSFQYNPDTVLRTLTPQGVGGDGGDRSEAFRLKGPPTETIKLDIEIDGTDQLAQPVPDPVTAQVGILPELAVLELMLYPRNRKLQEDIDLARAGRLEIIPAETALTVLVWGASRVVPVRLTEFSVTEEMHDVNLNPIRAKLVLGLRVLSVNDLPSEHRGTGLYLGYQQRKEGLAGRRGSAPLSTLGITRIP